MAESIDRVNLFFGKLFIVLGVLVLIKEAVLYGIVRVPVLLLIACGVSIHLVIYIAKKLTERVDQRIAELDRRLEVSTNSEDA